MKKHRKNSKSDCGCKKTASKTLKVEPMRESITDGWKTTRPIKQSIKEVADFINFKLQPFRGKRILIETTGGDLYGILNVLRNNYVVTDNKENNKIVDLSEVQKIVCENMKIVIKPNHSDVAELNEEAPKINLILKERMGDLFFSPMTEEIKNPDNAKTMTPAEKAARDKLAAKLAKKGDIRRIETAVRLDSQTEAEHRTATHIILCKRPNADCKNRPKQKPSIRKVMAKMDKSRERRAKRREKNAK